MEFAIDSFGETEVESAMAFGRKLPRKIPFGNCCSRNQLDTWRIVKGLLDWEPIDAALMQSWARSEFVD